MIAPLKALFRVVVQLLSMWIPCTLAVDTVPAVGRAGPHINKNDAPLRSRQPPLMPLADGLGHDAMRVRVVAS